MLNDIIVGALIFICVVAAVWGWWMENGPTKKDSGRGAKKESQSQRVHDQEDNSKEKEEERKG